MKRFKDVIARKRPTARETESDNRESIRDFSDILGERRGAQAVAQPAPDPAQEELERMLLNGEPPRPKPVEPIRRADIELERLVPKDPPKPMETFPDRTGNLPSSAAAKPTPAPKVRRTPAKAAPEPQAGSSGQPQIWDVDTPPAVPRPPAKQPAQPRPAQPGPPAAGGGRVKTRILGFHADDLPQDAFSKPARPAVAAVRYPAGWITVVEGPGRGHAFALASGVSKIGRGADQTVSLDFGDTSVSRDNHAAIAFDEEENRFFIGHGGKSNIVRLNGKPVLATEEMHNGDLVRIGTTTLRLVALCGPDFTWGAKDGDDDAADA